MGECTKVAVVGAGFIAEYHLEILQQIKTVNVVAVVDSQEQLADDLARKFSVPSSFGSIEKMLEAVKPDVAHILVPPHVHATVARELISKGIGVFVEKPLATDLKTCQALVQLAHKNGVVLGVNHNNLFHPSFVSLQQTVESGKIGRLQHVFACLNVPLRQLDTQDFRHWMFQEPRNIVFEQGVHPFSQIHALLGPVQSVSSLRTGKRNLGPGLTFYDTWQVSLQCERGTASVLLSFGKDFAENWLHAIGQDGAIHIDLLRRHSIRHFKTPWLDFYDQFKIGVTNAVQLVGQSTRNAVNYVLSTLKLRQPTDVFYLGMEGSINTFYEALNAGQPVPTSGNHATEVIEYCERATQGVEQENRTVLPISKLQASKAGKEILITGGTGFVGRHLVARLREQGECVRLMVRRPELLPESLRGEGISVVQGDIAQEKEVQDAIRASKAVMHLATGGGETWQQIQDSMVAGCKHVAEACVEFDIPMVFTSTIATLYLGNSDDQPVVSDTPVDPHADGRGLYARGKIACEDVLKELQKNRGLKVTIVRPGVVVGEGAPVQHSGVGLWTRDSQCFGWGFGNNPIPFVLVDEVADAMVSCLGKTSVYGKTYNLVGDVQLTARQYVDALRRRCGRDFQFHGQPLWSFQGTEIFKWIVKVVIRRPEVSFPSYRDLKTRALVRRFDTSAVKNDLDWKTESDLQTFLDLAIGWYSPQGILPTTVAEFSSSLLRKRQPEKNKGKKSGSLS
ncbi:MAG: Gfo/Idh/MocA family oxidoreductase [Methylococcaceae bacterium]